MLVMSSMVVVVVGVGLLELVGVSAPSWRSLLTRDEQLETLLICLAALDAAG